MKKISVLLFLLFSYSSWLSAQIENRSIFPTPNAANLGTFGLYGADLFTGVPNISIPLYTFKSRDISLPIALAYHPAGIKPSNHASWVGLGWSLQAGGAITRIQNDLPDELVDYHSADHTQRGFFYNYAELSSSTWATTAVGSTFKTAQTGFINQWYAPNNSVSYTRKDYAPDEFQFNFLGMSGSLMMGQDGQWHLISQQGLNFKVDKEIGTYALWEPNTNTSLAAKNTPSLIRTCLTRFILTGADGMKYYFGSSPVSDTHNFSAASTNGYFSTPDSAAVEFSRVGAGTGAVDARDGGTVAVTWYLTKIESPTGDVVTLSYTRDGPQINITTSTFGSTSTCPLCTPQVTLTLGAGDNVTIQDGCTLSAIYGANGSIQFGKSPANILDYTFLGSANSPQDMDWVNNLFPAYATEIFQGYNAPGGSGVKSIFMKLDNISIKDNNNNPLKSFNFNYTAGSTNRLFLNSVAEVASDGTTTIPPYTFSYNNIAGLNKVPYNTVQVDHWGYYMAQDPFRGALFPSSTLIPTTGNPLDNPSTFHAIYGESSQYGLVNPTYSSLFNPTFDATYVSNRNPIDGPMSYGILTQIGYPTGGNTQFVWEPNYYSKYINGTLSTAGYSFSVSDPGVNTIGPGSRIKQITSQANFNAPVITKSYTYYRDYVNNNYTSSGVLNSATPTYLNTYSNTDGTSKYTGWSNNNVSLPYYTNGSPITYSNVQESNSDGSYKTYTYSNHDNGYLDNTGTFYVLTQFPSSTPSIQSVNSNSLQLDRGLLLNEKTYALGSVLINSKTYTYNSDPTRLNTNIRKYTYDKKFSLSGSVISFSQDGFLAVSPGPSIVWGDITAALNTYIDYPFLQSTTEVQYDDAGANPLTRTTNYTYDGYRNKKTEELTTSTSANLLSTYGYAGDAGNTVMVNAGMVGVPLEKTVSKGTAQQMHYRVDYQTYVNTNSLIVPQNSFSSFKGNPLEGETKYINYDSYGNILEYIPHNGLTTSFQWGYNQAYPTAKVINAANTIRNFTVPTQTVGSSSAVWPAGVFASQIISFTQTQAGDISLGYGLSSFLNGASANLVYTLAGPSNQSGTLCSTTGGTCSLPGNVTFPNMPPGDYTLTLTVNSNYTIGSSAQVSYRTMSDVPATSGIKEFSYEGFEENTNPNVISGQAHTGAKYWNGGTYITAYAPPTSRKYIIQWWSLVGGEWVFQQQGYTGSTFLTGPVDDVRIFPADAQMSTYTYSPLVGMTSETDPSGKAIVYQYDLFQRLKTVRDQDNNILKHYDYQYQVPNQQTCNAPQSGTFTKSNCPPGNGGLPVTYTVPANTYCSSTPGAADIQAQNDVAANGQNHANGQPNETACHFSYCNAATSGTFTKTNCPSGYRGLPVTYLVPASTYCSLYPGVADPQAQADVAANGQTYANNQPISACEVWICNTLQSGTYTKTNCPSGYTGLPITYFVTAGTYCSSTPGVADQQARNQVAANGQNNANNQSVAQGCSLNPPTITGNTFFSTGSPNSSGTISGIAGMTVKVTIFAGGPTPNGYTLFASVNSGASSLGAGSTNSSFTFTFVMPASGVASWSGNFSGANSSGSGSISVSY